MIKFLKNNLTPPVIFLTFLNIGFFMVVQIAFFYIIASKQIDVIIKSKAEILNIYSKFSKKTRNNLKNYLKSPEFKEKKRQAELTEKERLRLNKLIIWKKLKYLLIVVLIIILVSIMLIIYFSMKSVQNKYNLSQERIKSLTLKPSDKILILFVLFAFSTELLFFFGLVQQHEFVGDMEILNIIYKRFAINYNKLN